MKKAAVFFVVLLVSQLNIFAQLADPARYVNPLIGTRKMGHTYPGATVPFGSVQLSPDTDEQPHNIGGRYNKETYRYCAGYQYDDDEIVGFSHTHFSGTGHSDLGDILIMPETGDLQLEPGTKGDPKSGFRSHYSHATEVAEPGYYKVKLDDDNIIAEMTATTRVGFHQYTFLDPPAIAPGSDKSNASIILDMMHGIYNYEDKNVWTFVRVENDHTVTGFRQTNGWARTRTVYFAMEFSKPFKTYGFKEFAKQDYKGFWRKFDQTKNFPEIAGKQIRGHFDFDVSRNEKIQVKVAISPVSTAGALANMKAELPGWDLERTKREARAAWNKELGKVSITADNQDELVNFYTAMYHAALSPTIYMDVDGRYKGLDQNVHQATIGGEPRAGTFTFPPNATEEERRSILTGMFERASTKNTPFTNYTTFSLWDTYRALHPLLNIIQPSRNRDMIRSMVAHYDQSVHHMLPVWSHYANENWCMIGYHSVSVIADSIVTGDLKGAEAEQALDAAIQTAQTSYYDGIGDYVRYGYVPYENNTSSVSKTLEYAYDDWAIAQAAQKLGRNEEYRQFSQRAENWKHLYDASTGFMRPKNAKGEFISEFDPLKTEGQGFIEGNAWNYSLYVPHDVPGMIDKMGGSQKFSDHLDELFTMHLPDEFFAETEDISRDGIIGGYIHGNEPSHHVAYLYDWTGDAWKTQERVRMILDHQYKPAPDGLGGNDDCGQMSAWYIFSALGFYPVAPASGKYQFGSPSVKTAALHLENGKTFIIEARDQGPKNVYVSRIELNGKPVNERSITFDQINAGGKLVYFMSPVPGK